MINPSIRISSKTPPCAIRFSIDTSTLPLSYTTDQYSTVTIRAVGVASEYSPHMMRVKKRGVCGSSGSGWIRVDRNAVQIAAAIWYREQKRRDQCDS
mmetsp:Transcript_25017/g.54164  ORF Transcript_25017/g.54164 Transcript_25017/m.54164 type:complete len:97 (+) Transcript_25017:437-727(+)